MKVHISLWSTFLPPNISESDQPLSLDSDDTTFVIAIIIIVIIIIVYSHITFLFTDQ